MNRLYAYDICRILGIKNSELMKGIRAGKYPEFQTEQVSSQRRYRNRPMKYVVVKTVYWIRLEDFWSLVERMGDVQGYFMGVLSAITPKRALKLLVASMHSAHQKMISQEYERLHAEVVVALKSSFKIGS